jgi:hypothetical protein
LRSGPLSCVADGRYDNAHLAGYTGHLPGVRDNEELIGARMATATAPDLMAAAQAQRPPTAVREGRVPQILGLQRETTGPAVLDHATGLPHELDSLGRSVGQGEKLPGYTGFVPGERGEYGHTYGHTHRRVLPQSPAVWCDMSPRSPRLVSARQPEAQLPGYSGFAPQTPRARGEVEPRQAVEATGAQYLPTRVFQRQLRTNEQYAERLSSSSIRLGAGMVDIRLA